MKLFFKLKCVLIFSILIFSSCKKEKRIEGNYAVCYNGLYAEVYFEKDSFRMASGLEFLSNNEQYRIVDDSLYHKTFSEDRTSASAKIEFLNKNEFMLFYHKDSVTHHFKSIDFDLDLNLSYEDFWKEFRVRKKERNCVQ